MRASTTISLFSLALSLYLAPFALADPTPKTGHAVKQLSDSNLFEAHLQHSESSHKRLPSEVINHHERDELVTAAPSAVSVPTAVIEISTSATSSPLPSTSAYKFTPRQPNHLIRHRAQRQGKQRLRKRDAVQEEEEESDGVDESEEAPEEEQEDSVGSQPIVQAQLPFAGLQLSCKSCLVMLLSDTPSDLLLTPSRSTRSSAEAEHAGELCGTQSKIPVAVQDRLLD
jgi:hypothetical protein